MTWMRADFDSATTYCEFDNYKIRTKGSSYIVDSVRFYTEFFSEPLIGQLNEKVLANKTGDKASYPRFESYSRRLQIQNIFKKCRLRRWFLRWQEIDSQEQVLLRNRLF